MADIQRHMLDFAGLHPHQREIVEWAKGDARPTDPALTEIRRRLIDYSSYRLPVSFLAGRWPIDKAAYVIGVDTSSSEGDVSVRFLTNREFYSD